MTSIKYCVALLMLVVSSLALAAVPPAATLVAPDGESSNNPAYSWNAVSNSTWYRLWVNDSTGHQINQWYTKADAGCESGEGLCSVTPDIQLADGNAQWWIQTWSSSGSGPWSNAKAIVIGTGAAPAAATLVTPVGGTSNTPTYTWNAVSISSWYHLWVNDSAGNPIRIWYTAEQAGCESGEGLCSVTPDTQLADGNAHWWIQTWSSSGSGPWSNAMSFHVSSAANGLFSVSDGRIIAPDGSDFVARGINIYNSTFYPNDYPTKGADAVDQIVTLFPKINMIRFAYQDDGPNNLFWSSTAVDDAFLATFVEAATSRRIVVLLEDHSTIGNFTWTQGQINAYTTFAARYKDNPYVWLGTENEPDSVDREGIVQNVRATYDAIRSTGNNNIVCILSRGGGYTEDILTYANYIQGGPVPNYPGSGPGAGGSNVTAMRHVIWDMHLYLWANPSASVAEVENTLWNGIDSEWGPFAGINVYRNGPQSADGIIPVIVGEWGLDWAGDNVQAVMLKTGPAPYPVGSLAWNWRAGDPDILVSGNARTPYGDAVNAFIDAGTGVPGQALP